MNDVPRDELISTLLDGELTADQRLQAERLLADDPACRQLYEELRLVRATVASLPRYTLDKDLSEGVLRRAERQMLLGSPPAEKSDSRDEASVEPLSTAEATWRRDWRTVLWPALVVAVALLLMVFNRGAPPPPDEPQMVQNGPIAEKAPVTGQQTGKAEGQGESEAIDSGEKPKTPDRIRASSAPPAPELAIPYIVAETAPGALRPSDFREVLQAQEIRLSDEPAPRRAPTRIGSPPASSSARTAIEEASRKPGEATETFYVITATRDQIERTIAALRGQKEVYTVVGQNSLPDAIAARDQQSRSVIAGEKQTAEGDRGPPPSVARRFTTRAEAEAAANEALREAPSNGAAAAELVTAIIGLRSPAPKNSNDDKAAPRESP